MANEPFDIGKLASGFSLFRGASLGKLIFTGLVAFIICSGCLFAFYKLFVQKTVGEVTTQTAETITNIEEKEDGFRVLGIELFGWRK